MQGSDFQDLLYHAAADDLDHQCLAQDPPSLGPLARDHQAGVAVVAALLAVDQGPQRYRLARAPFANLDNVRRPAVAVGPLFRQQVRRPFTVPLPCRLVQEEPHLRSGLHHEVRLPPDVHSIHLQDHAATVPLASRRPYLGAHEQKFSRIGGQRRRCVKRPPTSSLQLAVRLHPPRPVRCRSQRRA